MHVEHFEQKINKNAAFILMGGFSLMPLQWSDPIPIGQHCPGPSRSGAIIHKTRFIHISQTMLLKKVPTCSVLHACR